MGFYLNGIFPRPLRVPGQLIRPGTHFIPGTRARAEKNGPIDPCRAWSPLSMGRSLAAFGCLSETPVRMPRRGRPPV